MSDGTGPIPRATPGPARVALVWLEGAEPGTAPGHHLRGTLLRLEAIGVPEPLVLAETGDRGRLRRLLTVLVRSWEAVHDHDVLVLRWHVLAPLALAPWRVGRRRIVLLVPGVPSDVLSSHAWLRRFPGVVRSLSMLSLRWADALVVPHEGIAAQIVATVPGLRAPVRVAPNGPPPRVPGVAPARRDRPYVVFAGALARWQGIEVMLAAVDDPRWPEEVDLLVIGDGVEGPRVRAHAHPRVVPLGRLSPERTQAHVLGALASLSVKTHGPATEHGISPFKLQEAHALGVPVIATDLPGQGDYLRTTGGGLVIGPTAGELAGAVRRVLDPEARRPLADAARVAGAGSDWTRHADVLAESLAASPSQGVPG